MEIDSPNEITEIKKQVEKLNDFIQTRKRSARSQVEYFDFREISRQLSDVLNSLDEIEMYQRNPNTDYNELWEKRKQDQRDTLAAQQSWIQTEIFRMYFDFQENSGNSSLTTGSGGA